MATFTTTLSPGETKRGTFAATLMPGATITLGADSAAQAVITPVNFICPTAVLSADFNEGTSGDASGIGNGATSWTVPASAVISDGSPARVFVSWTAYNWRGAGSITLDGFGEVGGNYTPPTQPSEFFTGDDVPLTLAFPPEGGKVEFPLALADCRLEWDCREWRGNKWHSPFDKYFSASLSGQKLSVSVAAIPAEVLKSRNGSDFSGILTLISGEKKLSISVYAGYLIRAETSEIAELVPVSARETDATDTNSRMSPEALNYAAESYPGKEIKLSIRANDITNPDKPAAAPWLRAELRNAGEPGEEILLREKERTFDVRIEFDANPSEERRIGEVIISPEISPRSAVRTVFFQDRYQAGDDTGTDDGDDAAAIRLSPDSITFGAQAGSAVVSVTANEAAGTVSLLPDQTPWLTTSFSGSECRVSAEANDGATRSSMLVFHSENGAAQASLLITQLSAEETLLPAITLVPGELAFDAGGGRELIAVFTNAATGTLSVATDSDWISAATSDTSGMVSAAENNTGKERTGTVVFYGEFGGSAMLEVSQDAYTEDASIRVSPGTLEFSPAGGMQHVDIVTSGNAGAVQISTGADWLTVDADANVIAEANPFTQAREARIEFRGGNMPAGTGANVTVTQAGARKLPAAFYRGTRAK